MATEADFPPISTKSQSNCCPCFSLKIKEVKSSFRKQRGFRDIKFFHNLWQIASDKSLKLFWFSRMKWTVKISGTQKNAECKEDLNFKAQHKTRQNLQLKFLKAIKHYCAQHKKKRQLFFMFHPNGELEIFIVQKMEETQRSRIYGRKLLE